MAAGLDHIVAAVEELGVVPRPELVQLCTDQSLGSADGLKLLKLLVKQGRLTRFQANALHHGLVKALVIGEYLVLDKLGSGGMGDVYKAQHRRMKRIVAIKLLPAAATRNPQMVRRFYREVEAAGKLIHPNIVTAYDAGEHNGVHYLVMEYVQGQDLGSVVKESGAMPLKQALACATQAARGLAYAHEHGVIHRDIKPANLILTDDGVVKVLDMGLARIEQEAAQQEHSLTGDGTMGTPDYMAPEQALNAKHADHRSDIYSLGCTLYRIATGQFPFAGSTLMEKLMAQREAPAPSLASAVADCPPRLEAAFAMMLAKRPEDRFQTMAQVVAELEACEALLSASPVERDLAALAMAMAGEAHHAAIPTATAASSALREPSSLVTLEPTGQVGSTLLRLHEKAAEPSRPQRRRSRRPLALGGIAAALLLAAGAMALWRGGDIEHRTPNVGAVPTIPADDAPAPAAAAKLAANVAAIDPESITPAPAAPAVPNAGATDDPLQWRFTDPENLGQPVNTAAGETTPSIAQDGLLLAFTSDRPDGLGANDVWMARRSSIDEPFGQPFNPGSPVNSKFNETNAFISADGLTLLLASDRPNGRGGGDIWIATRPSIDADFQPPKNVGPPINTNGWDFMPALSADGLTLAFASDRGGGQGSLDVWFATRGSTTAPFGPPFNPGPPINSPQSDGAPCLSPDGLTLVFCSARPGSLGSLGDHDLWIAHRASLSDPFGQPTHLHALSSASPDWDPRLAPDGSMLFSSGRPGGQGRHDIWMSRTLRPGFPAQTPSPTATLRPHVPPPHISGEKQPVLSGLLSAGDVSPIERLACSPDGDLLAVAHGGPRPAVHLWRISTRTWLYGWPVQNGGVADLAFSPDGQTLAFAEIEGPVIRRWSTTSGRPLGSTTLRFTEKYIAIAFSPVEPVLAVAGDKDTLMLINLETNKATQRQSRVWWPKDLEFLPDSPLFVVTGHLDMPGGRFEVWDSRTAEPQSIFDQRMGMGAVSITGDGSMIGVASGRLLHLVQMQSREYHAKLEASERGPVSDVDLQRGGGLAVTAAGDRTVRLWDLREARELSRITAPEGVETPAAAFCGDGRTLAIAWQKRVLLFDVSELVTPGGP